MKARADKPKHASVKPCPFCGNREWGAFNAVIDESFNVQIKCGQCGALGPIVNLARCETRSKAKDLACMKWDKRASQAGAAGGVCRSLDLLRVMWDRYENGDPCYYDGDQFLGNAFRLSEAEEAEILDVIADAPTPAAEGEAR